MNSKKSRDTTQRILMVYHELIKDGIVEHKSDFCKKVGFDVTSFSQVLSNSRPFPNKYIDKLCSEFDIKKEYLLTGNEPKYNSDQTKEAIIRKKLSMIEELVSEIKDLL